MQFYKMFLSALIVLIAEMVVPGLLSAQPDSPEVYRLRREKLLSRMDTGMAIFKGSSDNFYYLTGYRRPDAAMALMTGQRHEFNMFLPAASPLGDVYTGHQYGPEDAVRLYGADTAYTLSAFDAFVHRHLQKDGVLYADMGERDMQELLSQMMRQGRLNGLQAVRNISQLIDGMRLIKDGHEVQKLQKAIDITGLSFQKAMAITQPGLYEYEVEAAVEYVFRKNGARQPGFESIVASGSNATILHYHHNNERMHKGELLLMDIGAEYERYTADITRTIPVSGTFSREQAQLYRLVHEALRKGTQEMVPGKGIYEAHHRATDIIIRGLYQLGLVTDTSSPWQRKFYTLYPIGHWLGLDVHDVGYYGENNIHDNRGEMVNKNVLGTVLRPGMVVTIEPGIYMRENVLDKLQYLFPEVPQAELNAFAETVKPAYKRYAGIGIRIEDDVLITSGGNEVLSGEIPKSIEAIEQGIGEVHDQPSLFH
ncbi:MAG: aminopeptidase P N-terminal domain-containing protein [Bacteroidales bacterium]|nr:aminopeptidase P N-terminal domain-containing protein [Bacteroidales bacterium]